MLTHSLQPQRPAPNKRATERRDLAIPARLTWKDQRGTTRFASVVTRNVSTFGVYVECVSVVSISLYRLVHFQIERDARYGDRLPEPLGDGRILSAVYRVIPPTGGGRQGLALRLIVDPRRREVDTPAARATA